MSPSGTQEQRAVDRPLRGAVRRSADERSHWTRPTPRLHSRLVRPVRASVLAATAAFTVCTSACSGPQVRVDREQRTVEAHTDSTRLTYQFGPVGTAWEPITIDGNDAAWHDRTSDGVIHIDHACG